MKPASLLSQVLLLATSGAIAQKINSPTGIPEFSLDAVGMTLPAANGTQLTSVQGQWTIPTEFDSGIGEPGFEFMTQFVSFDLLPVPFNLFDEPLPSLPPTCPNFLQIGTNITIDWPTQASYDTDTNFTQFNFAYYIFNNITTNITTSTGLPLLINPGETVTVTVNASLSSASFIFNTTEHGAVSIELEGELCLEYVQWAIGSPTTPGDVALIPFTFDQTFSNSFATQLNLTTGDIKNIGPDSAVHTILVVDQEIRADVENPNDQGFTIGFEPDCADYKRKRSVERRSQGLE